MARVASIHDLENKKMSSLIWQYALPAIIGTSVNALYNIIDRYFIGNAPYLTTEAMSAIGIALPIMTIITAVGMLIGAGSASRISIFLGQGNKDKAEKILGNALLLSLCLTLPTSIILLIFIEPILHLLGATNETYAYAHEFLIYLLPGSIFSTMCFGFNNMMRASGYPQRAMYTMIVAVIINILLAPLFIYVFGWGMKGAALATVIAMFSGMCFVMHHFLNKRSTLKLLRENIRFDKEIVKSILSIGMSPFLIQLVASAVTFLMIHQLQRYGGDVAIGAYTLMNTLVMLVLMVVTGLTQGMQPIVGYNYGAQKTNRVVEALKYTTKVGIVIGSVGTIIGMFIPELVVKPFNPINELSSESAKLLAEEAANALHICTIMLPLVGYQIVATSFFQSIGMVKKSIFLSLTRQLFILIPSVFILPLYWGLNGVWAALPVADFLAALLTSIVFYFQIKEFKKIEANKLITNR